MIAKRKQRWLEFYDAQHPRSRIFLVRWAPDLPARPLPRPELARERIEWIWANYEYHLERMQWLDDDSLPYLDMLGGTEIFAEAFGCRVFYPDDNNPFAIPMLQSAAQAEAVPIPSLDAPPLALAFSMADELAQRAGPEALFRLVDMQCPLDVAAVMWEKTDFFPALIQNPQAVVCLVEKIKTLQFRFLDEWFRRYGKEFIAHYPDYYLTGGISLSVDEIGSVSSRMFRQFFLPELNDFSRHFGGLGMHCCANSRHQWSNMLEIENLVLLNINQPEQTLLQVYPYFAGHVPQWHYGWDPDPNHLDEWLAQMPPEARLVVDVTAATEEQARQLSRRIGELRR